MLDDRQIHAVRLIPVAVVMAEDTAALERIISHVRRVRGEHSRRPIGARTPLNRTTPSPSATVPQDLCQNPVLVNKPREQSHGAVTAGGKRGGKRRRAVVSAPPGPRFGVVRCCGRRLRPLRRRSPGRRGPWEGIVGSQDAGRGYDTGWDVAAASEAGRRGDVGWGFDPERGRGRRPLISRTAGGPARGVPGGPSCCARGYRAEPASTAAPAAWTAASHWASLAARARRTWTSHRSQSGPRGPISSSGAPQPAPSCPAHRPTGSTRAGAVSAQRRQGVPSGVR